MLESTYQARLIKKLKREFNGCYIIMNDAGYLQGIPDLLILHKHRWAMLEVKASMNAPQQANQQYYVDLFNEMAYAAFIYPENEEEVFYDLQHAFASDREARFSQR